MQKFIIPPFLKPGDTIGIAATARKVAANEIDVAISAAKNEGFKVILASSIYKEDHQFSGTDQDRAAGVNEMLHHPDVKAIWCARGGYGSVRILDLIDWNQLRNTPKWICGFSDVTAIHAHLQQQLSMASLHSEMLLGYAKNTAATHQSFFNALRGEGQKYTYPSHNLNRNGHANAQVVGGNLSVLYSLLGSADQLKTEGKILFIEDLDEYLYHIDRMMMALKRAGMLRGLKALVVGGMSDMNDNAIPFGKCAEVIIREAVADQNYPVCFQFPAGHLPENKALVFGASAELIVGETVTFTQKF